MLAVLFVGTAIGQDKNHIIPNNELATISGFLVDQENVFVGISFVKDDRLITRVIKYNIIERKHDFIELENFGLSPSGIKRFDVNSFYLVVNLFNQSNQFTYLMFDYDFNLISEQSFLNEGGFSAVTEFENLLNDIFILSFQDYNSGNRRLLKINYLLLQKNILFIILT